MSSQNILKVAAISGALAVILGAFGAHALQKILDAAGLARWETANRYQMIHALALLGTALLNIMQPSKWTGRASWFFLVGTICFSGSVYLFAFSSVLTLDLSWLGPITPLGGMFFIVGWFSLFRFAQQFKSQKADEKNS